MKNDQVLSNDVNFKRNAEYINTILDEIQKVFVKNNPLYKDEIYTKITNDGNINIMTLFRIIAVIKFDEETKKYKSVSADVFTKGREPLNLDGLVDVIYHIPSELITGTQDVWMQ